MGALMNPAHLIRLDARLPALIAEVDAAGRSGRSWLATWRQIAPTLLVITGSSAEHPRLRSREAFPVLKEHLLSVWLRGSNPGPLPTDSWEADDVAAQAASNYASYRLCSEPPNLGGQSTKDPSTRGASGPTGRGSSEWAAGSGMELNPLSFLGANPSVNLTIRQHTTLATADRRLQRWQMADMRGDVALASSGAATLNDAHAEQVATVPVDALEAGTDLEATVKWAHPRACTLVSVGYLSAGSFGTVSDASTAVFAVTDGAGNAIASKTFNTAAQPSATAINDFGALDATHKALPAEETVSLAITNGSTAATPAGQLVIRYIPTNA